VNPTLHIDQLDQHPSHGMIPATNCGNSLVFLSSIELKITLSGTKNAGIFGEIRDHPQRF
jgi:hypothetical protein